MINELQRQTYLSALGIDTYMPRWHLPFAPASVACALPEYLELPAINEVASVANNDTALVNTMHTPLAVRQTENNVIPISNLINDIFDSKKTKKLELPLKESIKQSANLSTAKVIEAFSLSVWRPVDGVMIVDSRNTKLALPTDALLKNIFRHIYPQTTWAAKEEILRCPMIENSFAKRTENDARAELQTWLSVQCEIRPIKYLWLMGKNSAMYLIADTSEQDNRLWNSSPLAESAIEALILPSLNELLISPLLKKSLFSALRAYHS